MDKITIRTNATETGKPRKSATNPNLSSAKKSSQLFIVPIASDIVPNIVPNIASDIAPDILPDILANTYLSHIYPNSLYSILGGGAEIFNFEPSILNFQFYRNSDAVISNDSDLA